MERTIETYEMLKADGIIIFFNVLQEAFQREGDPNVPIDFWTKFIENLKDLNERGIDNIILKAIPPEPLDVNLIGHIISNGIKILGVMPGGAGGTNWIKIENLRERGLYEIRDYNLASQYEVITCLKNNYPSLLRIWNGGIRNPLDAVLALKVGANMVAMARPIIQHLISIKKPITVEVDVYHMLVEKDNLRSYLLEFITKMNQLYNTIKIAH